MTDKVPFPDLAAWLLGVKDIPRMEEKCPDLAAMKNPFEAVELTPEDREAFERWRRGEVAIRKWTRPCGRTRPDRER